MTRPEPRSDLRGLEGYHSPQVDVDVRLNTNESPFAPPTAFVEEWLGALREAPLHRYPDRAVAKLRSALGTHLGADPATIFCANGSNEVLQTLLLAYGGFGRRAVVFEPSYALHTHIAEITGTDLVVGERRDDYTVDPDEAAKLIADSDPAVTFLCSPNNPSGTVEPLATIEAVLAATDGLVVVDEAYGEFAPQSALTIQADHDRLVVVRTFSKVWSMAAVRLGFCVAAPGIVALLDKVVLPYALSTPTQLAGELALGFTDEMARRVETLVTERERLRSGLEALDGLTVFPSGANFLLVRVADDGHALWQRLLDRGVLVRDFSRRERLDDCLRITVGTPDENDACLEAFAGALGEDAA